MMKKTSKKNLKNRGIEADIVRLKKCAGVEDLNGTRRIIAKIISAYEFQKQMDGIEKS